MTSENKFFQIYDGLEGARHFRNHCVAAGVGGVAICVIVALATGDSYAAEGLLAGASGVITGAMAADAQGDVSGYRRSLRDLRKGNDPQPDQEAQASALDTTDLKPGQA